MKLIVDNTRKSDEDPDYWHQPPKQRNRGMEMIAIALVALVCVLLWVLAAVHFALKAAA